LFAQSCGSGDCQPDVIAGPYSAPQTSENTAANFPVCTSAPCRASAWVNDQIEGIDAQQNIGTAYQFYDNVLNLDTNIAVGESAAGENAQVLQWMNSRYLQAFDKVSGQAIFTNSGGTTTVPQNAIAFWPAATQPECQLAAGNVQVIYDRMDSRFILSRRSAYLVGGIVHYAMCVAVSSSSDLSNPQTVWYAYDFKMDTVLPCVPSSDNCTVGTTYYFPDWPRIGTWSNGFYITFDLEDPTEGFTEAGFEACQLDRADMALGHAANPMTCYTYLVPVADQPTLIHSLDVADIDSASGPPNGEPEYFLGIVNPSNAQQGGNGEDSVYQRHYAMHIEPACIVYLERERACRSKVYYGESLHAGLLRHVGQRHGDQYRMRAGAPHEFGDDWSLWLAFVRRLQHSMRRFTRRSHGESPDLQ